MGHVQRRAAGPLEHLATEAGKGQDLQSEPRRANARKPPQNVLGQPVRRHQHQRGADFPPAVCLVHAGQQLPLEDPGIDVGQDLHRAPLSPGGPACPCSLAGSTAPVNRVPWPAGLTT